jgi:hypothetical protein
MSEDMFYQSKHHNHYARFERQPSGIRVGTLPSLFAFYRRKRRRNLPQPPIIMGRFFYEDFAEYTILVRFLQA